MCSLKTVFIFLSISSRGICPFSDLIGLGITAAYLAIFAASKLYMWHFSSSITSVPSFEPNLTAIVFPIVPEGTNKAASFPTVSAANSSSF